MPQTKTDPEVYPNCTDETLDFRTLDSGDATEEEPLDLLDEDKCELRDRLENEEVDHDIQPSGTLQTHSVASSRPTDEASNPTSSENWSQYPSTSSSLNPAHTKPDDGQISHVPPVFSHHGGPLIPSYSAPWSPRFLQPFSPTFWVSSTFPPHGHHHGPPHPNSVQMDPSSGPFSSQSFPDGMLPYSCQPPFPMFMPMNHPSLLSSCDPNLLAINQDGVPCQPPIHLQFSYPPFDHPVMDPNFQLHPDHCARRNESCRWYQSKPGHIKKPLNAFMLFMREMRPKILKDCGEKESTAINQIIGRQWQALSKEEQAKYYELAKQEKDEHQRLYPNWTPRDQFQHSLRKRRRRERANPNDPIPKKCRARFGLDHQDQWCKPCRRKKKCARFSGSEENCSEIITGQSLSDNKIFTSEFSSINPQSVSLSSGKVINDTEITCSDNIMTVNVDDDDDDDVESIDEDINGSSDENKEDGENYPPFSISEAVNSPTGDEPKPSKPNFECDSSKCEIDSLYFSTFNVNSNNNIAEERVDSSTNYQPYGCPPGSAR